MLPSQHEDDKVDDSEKKPDIVLFYNNIKGGVDSVDQMARNYSVKRGARRWPETFFTIIDIECINSVTLIIGNFLEWSRRRNLRLLFLWDLTLELRKPQLEKRGNDISRLNKTVVSAMEIVLVKKLMYQYRSPKKSNEEGVTDVFIKLHQRNEV